MQFLRNFLRIVLLSVLFLFAQSCEEPTTYEVIVINENFSEIPIILVFPSEKYRELYEDILLERVELANGIYKHAGVYFYVMASIVRNDYHLNVEIDKSDARTLFSSWYSRAIPIIVVNSINDANHHAFSGFAITKSICGKFILTTNPNRNATTIISHEFGHIFGLNHADDPENIMFPFLGDKTILINSDQENKVKERSQAYYANCVLELI